MYELIIGILIGEITGVLGGFLLASVFEIGDDK